MGRLPHAFAQYLCVFLLLFGTVGLWALSRHFPYARPVREAPIASVVLMLAAMGVVYLLFVRSILCREVRRRVFITAIVAGAAGRLCLLFSTPILETDFYRYLWDGGVVVSGGNPYTVVPQQALQSKLLFASGMGEVVNLDPAALSIVKRVNHPWLRTIYPPVSQAFFALAHHIQPWSLTAWRLVLVLMDCITALLIALLLKRLRYPAAYLLIYWWNPLLLKETYNSAHMETLLFPFLIGALWFAKASRFTAAVLCLVIAAGIKIWPALLLPLLLRPLVHRPARAVSLTVLFVVSLGTMYWPLAAAGLGETSGLAVYAQRWQMNEGLYRIGSSLLLAAARVSGLPSHVAHSASRLIVAMFVALVAIAVCSRPAANFQNLSARALIVTAALFLLSPTQFPWYWLWMLPLLVFQPSIGLLFYTVTLPLYYARFMYSSVGAAALFDWGIVWLEHGPVIILLAYEWRRATTAEHSAAVSAGSCEPDHSFVPASDFRSSPELDA